MTRPTIVWLRDDLRLADNPALSAAALRGGPVLPVYILDDDAAGDWRPGAAARWWLGRSLDALAASLEARGGRLVRRQGDSLDVLRELIAETGADAVFWNRRYTPAGVAQDIAVKASLKEADVVARSFKASLLVEPMEVEGHAGSFSAFFERWRALARPSPPLPVLERIPGIELPSDRLALLPPDAPHWVGKLEAAWAVGEAAAQGRLASFVERGVRHYGKGRHQLGVDGVSGLSPHLHAGEIGPDAILRAVPERQGFAFIRQLAWREYAAFLLFREPLLPAVELFPDRRFIAWHDDAEGLRAWQRGETGYELVDAGMRQLWATGWMHNRARMVVASFLTKHLLIDWRLGQRWFWDTLVDADLANNAMGWQWAASVGADAAGFVRVFDPVAQAEKFDADGTYRQRWLGSGPRPAPIVEHRAARQRALAAYAAGSPTTNTLPPGSPDSTSNVQP
jgi:deoxyribodipyrimidine photo-lyase